LLRAQLFGLTGLGDRTIFTVFSTPDFHEQQTVQLGHDFRLGSQGLSISGLFTYAWARPDIPDAHVLSKSLIGTLEIAYPFVRRQAMSMRGSVGLDYVDQDVWLDHIALSRDHLRVGFARFGIDAISSDFSDPRYSLEEPRWHVTSLFELRQGLDILGASPFCGDNGLGCGPNHVPTSRIQAHSTATDVRWSGYGEIRPIPKLTFALGARAQYSWDPLLSFEQFAAGNYTVGRGYDPGALLGDIGAGTQTEIRYGSRIPESAQKPGIEGYAFWDYAWVRNHEQAFAVPGPRHLNSVGGGARVNFDRFYLDAALAFPLNRAGIETRKPGPRFLISLTSRLWPWSYQ
jgi:hemolysin activation/secretion protein